MSKVHNYNGWEIMGYGGFCTIRHFWAEKGELRHWAFKLRDCKILCDERDKGNQIDGLYLRPLYI